MSEARALRPGLEIIDRCNLTVLLEPGQEDLADFLAAHRVRVVASLPCYGKDNVDAQRGGGVFARSIQGLRLLNAAGYGRGSDSGGGESSDGDGAGNGNGSSGSSGGSGSTGGGGPLLLDLVYNPGGAFLAPPREKLEPAYRRELLEVGFFWGRGGGRAMRGVVLVRGGVSRCTGRFLPPRLPLVKRS